MMCLGVASLLELCRHSATTEVASLEDQTLPEVLSTLMHHLGTQTMELWASRTHVRTRRTSLCGSENKAGYTIRYKKNSN